VYRVDLPGGAICVKRALSKLKVAADWHAPVERNHAEVEWMRVARGIVPAAVPAILGEDREGGCFAMAYLAPDRHPVWKSQLMAGTIEIPTAEAVGDTLGRIHAATADDDAIAKRFATDDTFHAIRLEPYLVATGRQHAQLAEPLARIVEVTRKTKRTLVHGDYSPKNILIAPEGPVIIDAECAWYGDPAFDLAFVLNHLLLKGAHHPRWRGRYVEAFMALVSAYVPHVHWEPAPELEARSALLLPALMLARVDGKSPVEYLVDADVRERVRRFAMALVVDPPARVGDLGLAWVAESA
jgi:5-methylthioribose kinase